MSRFAAWASQQRTERVDGELSVAGIPIDKTPKRELEPFLVDNSGLSSRSAGLRYRSSRNAGEKNQALKSVRWGSVVWGVLDEEGEWLKVKPGRYLPVRVDGVPVLTELPPMTRPDSDEDTSPVESQTHLGKLKVPDMFRPVTEESSLELGLGCWYQVVAERLALRQGPSMGAAAIFSFRKGHEVEIFGWDETRLWRQCREPKTALVGWVLLDHPDLGPLVRPKGMAMSSRPLVPLCAAAGEGRLADLRRFLDAQPFGVAVATARDAAGRGPLALAASAGHLACVVRLVEAGADAEDALQDCRNRAETLGAAGPLLEALAGRSPDPVQLQSAMVELNDEERQAVQGMAAAKRAAGRGVMGKRDLLDAMEEEVATDVPDSPMQPELPGALGTLGAAAQAEAKEAQAKEAKSIPLEKKGVLYEVVFDAVWIRQEPNSKGAKLTKRVKRDRLRVTDFDETQNWGKVQVHLSEGDVEGWVMLLHEDLGELIRPCADDDDEGGLIKPEDV